jgi:quercetin dioxygenase-like cupin family protein
LTPDPAPRGDGGDTTGGEVIFLPPGAGRVYEQGGFRGAIKVDDAESAGRQCFSEWTVDPGDDGPPPHLHRSHQEAFFVVEGTLSFRVGDETIEAEAGAFVFIPPGVVHAFSNRTDEPARCVNAYVPGGIEGFFVEVGELMADGQADPAEIKRLSAKYDIYFEAG